MRLIFTLTVLCSLYVSQLLAQDSVTVIPGHQYEAGWLHKLFFGSGWRDLWTTPISAEVFDTPAITDKLRNDGGMLRFRGSDGRDYLFRPLTTEAQFAAPDAIYKTFTDSLAQDFVSANFPVPELITSLLYNAVGLPAASYRLIRLPDDPKLEENFAGSVGILEVEPPTGVLMATNTRQLLNRLASNTSERVDAESYLQTRLMDIYFGQWDRSKEDFEWRAARIGGQTKWSPIPYPPTQAFSRYGGLAGWRVTQEIPEIESFSDSYPWISDLTWSGRQLDRRLLSGLEREEWNIVTNDILAALTDEAIETAVREIPPAMYKKEGEHLVRMLKARRDKFKDASEEYYENLARFVDIHASDQNEYADIERIGNDSVIVSLYNRDRNAGGATGVAFFQRTFDRKETREIRLYLHGGDDFTVVRGNAMHSIPLRIIGGDGDDELADSSQVRQKLFGIIGVPKTATYFYESDRKAEFIYGPSTKSLDDDFERPEEDSLLYEPLYRDWGHAWKGAPWLGANSDDGIFVGAIARLTNYGFRAIPYRDKATFRFGYAFGPNRYRAVIDHEFPNIFSGTINLHAHASGLETINFFGLGNNTAYSSELAQADAYKVNRQEYALLPSYAISPLTNITIRGHAGLRLNTLDTSDRTSSGIVLRIEKPYGIQDALYSSFGISGTYDSRDNPVATQHGAYFTLGNLWNPEIFDNRYAYTKAYTEFRGFYTAPVLGGITLAVRAQGEKIFGNRFPFYDASFLGGIADLRGYSRERFSGDASVLATAELRVNLGTYSIVTSGMFGVHVFAEEGRVFYDGETSEARHGSFGGGIWLAPVSIENTVALTFAKSPEQLTFALTGGFAF